MLTLNQLRDYRLAFAKRRIAVTQSQGARGLHPGKSSASDDRSTLPLFEDENLAATHQKLDSMLHEMRDIDGTIADVAKRLAELIGEEHRDLAVHHAEIYQQVVFPLVAIPAKQARDELARAHRSVPGWAVVVMMALVLVLLSRESSVTASRISIVAVILALVSTTLTAFNVIRTYGRDRRLDAGRESGLNKSRSKALDGP